MVYTQTPIAQGFKGYRKGLKGRDKQYRENEVFEEEGAFQSFKRGLYFCENPLDVFRYYPPSIGTEYTRVEALGKVRREGEKSSTDKLKIGSQLSAADIFNTHFEYLFNKNPVCDVSSYQDFRSCFSQESDSFSFSKGWKGHSIVAGCGSYSKSVGRGGHSAAFGSHGSARTEGSKAHAHSSGNFGCASTIGPGGHATNSGRKGYANTVGFESHAHSNGDRGVSNTCGNMSHSSSNGFKSFSNTLGAWSHAVSNGHQGSSSTCGIASNAISNGQEGISMVGGEEAIAFSSGIKGKAAASEGWIIIVDWRKDEEGKFFIYDVHRAKVGEHIVQETLIKPNTWYWFEEGKLKSQKVFV